MKGGRPGAGSGSRRTARRRSPGVTTPRAAAPRCRAAARRRPHGRGRAARQGVDSPAALVASSDEHDEPIAAPAPLSTGRLRLDVAGEGTHRRRRWRPRRRAGPAARRRSCRRAPRGRPGSRRRSPRGADLHEVERFRRGRRAVLRLRWTRGRCARLRSATRAPATRRTPRRCRLRPIVAAGWMRDRGGEAVQPQLLVELGRNPWVADPPRRTVSRAVRRRAGRWPEERHAEAPTPGRGSALAGLSSTKPRMGMRRRARWSAPRGRGRRCRRSVPLHPADLFQKGGTRGWWPSRWWRRRRRGAATVRTVAKDPQVQPERAALDVAHVVGELRSHADALRPRTWARPVMPGRTSCRSRLLGVYRPRYALEQRPRPDQAHVAAQHVPQRRQLVEAGRAQEPPAAVSRSASLPGSKPASRTVAWCGT